MGLIEPEESTFLMALTERANKCIREGLDPESAIEDEGMAMLRDPTWIPLVDQVRLKKSGVKIGRSRESTRFRVRRRTLKAFSREMSLFEGILSAAELANHNQVSSTLKIIDRMSPLLGIEDTFGGPVLKCLLLSGLHARTIEMGDEILHCLKGGYSEAAAARTRSILEASIVLWFLCTGGLKGGGNIDLCERYYVSSLLEWKRTGGQTDGTAEELLSRARDHWGKDFSQPLGWASHLLPLKPKERPTLRHLAEFIQADEMLPEYRNFHNSIHAGSLNIVARTDFRAGRPSPHPTRPNFEPQHLRRVADAALRCIDAATYISTKTISSQTSRWDDMQAVVNVRLLTDEALTHLRRAATS